MDSREKAKHKSHYARCVSDARKAANEAAAQSSLNSSAGVSAEVMGGVAAASAASGKLSREARSNQRRLLTAFGLENDSDLLKFNQLKVIDREILIRS